MPCNVGFFCKASEVKSNKFELALVLQDRKPFGIGLHESVLDAVVDHLGVVTRADRTDITPALGLAGGERLEDRPMRLDVRRVAADHEAVAFGEAPDPAARAAVDVVDLLRRKRGGAALRIAIVRVAAVDERVAGLQQGLQGRNRVIGDLPRGHHEPDRARWLQLADQLRKRGCGAGALGFERAARRLGRVVADDLMAAAHESLGHVRAHASQTDHGKFHSVPIQSGAKVRVNAQYTVVHARWYSRSAGGLRRPRRPSGIPLPCSRGTHRGYGRALACGGYWLAAGTKYSGKSSHWWR
jgi:hypothetical protein